MTESAVQQIYDLVSALWDKIDHQTPNPEILESFSAHMKNNPAIHGMLNKMAFRDTSRLNDETEFFHAFRDPFSQAITGLTGRVHDFNKGRFPVKGMDMALALTCFHLEKVHTRVFRKILNIAAEDHSSFAELLIEIDTVIAPKIRSLLPQALEESGNTMENFNHHYQKLETNPSRSTKDVLSFMTAISGPFSPLPEPL